MSLDPNDFVAALQDVSEEKLSKQIFVQPSIIAQWKKGEHLPHPMTRKNILVLLEHHGEKFT